MSNQLDEARSRISELKRLLVAAMADEQRLYQKSSEASREAERWEKRAELAAGKGAEDLARGALERFNKYNADASEYREQYLEQKGHVERIIAALLELERRTRETALTATRLTATVRPERLAKLELWESPARRQRASLAAWAALERDELADKLAVLEREEHLDQQLAELKRRLGTDQAQKVRGAES